jgi:hypothetical protein
MNAEEFVLGLRRCLPSQDEAAARGFLPEEIADLHARYTCAPRAGRLARSHVLEDLLNRHDVGRLHIGRVSFVSDPRPHWSGSIVATFEAQPVVVTRAGSVSVFEPERFGEKLLDCAPDGERFLAALLAFMSAAHATGPELPEPDRLATHCSQLAGGPLYEPFYIALCSVLEYGQGA